MEKFICTKDTKNFIKNKIYNCTTVQQGLMFLPYIISEKQNIISEKQNKQIFPKKSIKSRYSITTPTSNYEKLKIEGNTLEPEIHVVGYNVVGEENILNYFILEKFNKHFKNLKKLRLKKLQQINEK